MDISDKLIIVCIIFAILAILSIVFGCFYFSSKPENFKNKTSKEAFIIEKMVDLFKNKSEDFKIIEMMKTYKEQFKNEKFLSTLVGKLTEADLTEAESEAYITKAEYDAQRAAYAERAKKRREASAQASARGRGGGRGGRGGRGGYHAPHQHTHPHHEGQH